MKLVFDTETTGLVRHNLPATDPKQPRLVQIAGVLIDDAGLEQSVFSFIIQPDGFEIPANASDVHGITTTRAKDLGIPLLTALSVFNNIARIASEVWAFNAAFDSVVVRGEMFRIGKESVLETKVPRCAMLACKNILRLPPNFAGGDWKWPKLSEAYSFFFDGAEIEKAHDALGDVRATVRVMQATEDWIEAKEG